MGRVARARRYFRDPTARVAAIRERALSDDGTRAFLLLGTCGVRCSYTQTHTQTRHAWCFANVNEFPLCLMSLLEAPRNDGDDDDDDNTIIIIARVVAAAAANAAACCIKHIYIYAMLLAVYIS